LRDPEHPTQMRPSDDCGDGLHPSDAGYNKMGDAIDLALFE
jgi:lysophospholipase L1-like esterase